MQLCQQHALQFAENPYTSIQLNELSTKWHEMQQLVAQRDRTLQKEASKMQSNDKLSITTTSRRYLAHLSNGRTLKARIETCVQISESIGACNSRQRRGDRLIDSSLMSRRGWSWRNWQKKRRISLIMKE